MKRILFILLYTIPFIGFGQNDLPIVPKNLGDYYNISNHSKSLTNFGFRIPQGFNEYRDGRDKSIDPNEFVIVYEKNDLFWIKTGTWSKEKNLYLIMSTHYTNKQSIQLSFMSNIKGNVEEDVKRIKKLINSFKYL